jgi:cysteinyl-tRNA synthetase
MSEGEKMSKSLGNFYTVRDLLDEFHGEALRLALLQTHYRAPLDFTKDGVRRAKATLDRFYGALRGVDSAAASQPEPPPELIAALCDDLNTPLALSVLHEAVSALNAARDGVEKSAARNAVVAAGALLGLLQRDPEDWFRRRGAGDQAFDEAVVEAMISARAAARSARDFAESDRIRDVLAGDGVILEDKPDGTIWRRR